MKVGDYVRTKDGYIAKIEKEFDESYLCDDTVEYIYEPLPFIPKDKLNEMIIKSSPNIIDLIEIGDIVNYGLIGGGMVLHKKNDEIATNSLLFGIFKNEDIKSVITREQIENNMYKVGD